MLKKQAALLLIAGALMLGGCFGTNESSDKGSGVKLVRAGERVKVLVEDEIVGGSFVVNRTIEAENILVEADKMKIVKVRDGKTYISIVDVDSPSVEGEKIFEIKNCLENVTIEVEESINDKIFEKELKKAFKTAKKNGTRATTTDALLRDFSKNNIVDLADFIMFKENYGSTVTTCIHGRKFL